MTVVAVRWASASRSASYVPSRQTRSIFLGSAPSSSPGIHTSAIGCGCQRWVARRLVTAKAPACQLSMFTKTYTDGMTAMLRVSVEVRDHAAALAAAEDVSIGELVGQALSALERERFWRQTQEALLNGTFDDEGWDATLRDGLADG